MWALLVVKVSRAAKKVELEHELDSVSYSLETSDIVPKKDQSLFAFKPRATIKKNRSGPSR
jgi:hypothetical protein